MKNLGTIWHIYFAWNVSAVCRDAARSWEVMHRMMACSSMSLLSAACMPTSADEGSPKLHEVIFVNTSGQGIILLDLPVADFRDPPGRIARFDLHPRSPEDKSGRSSPRSWVFSNERTHLPDSATLLWQLAEVGYCPEPDSPPNRCELVPVDGKIHRWTLDLRAMRDSAEGHRMGQFIGPYEGRYTLKTRISIQGDSLEVELSNGTIGAASWK